MSASAGSPVTVREPSARYLFASRHAATLVDSCVLIDVLADHPHWAEWSLAQLERCAQQGPLVINPIILAEISPRFECAADLDAARARLPLPDFLRWSSRAGE